MVESNGSGGSGGPLEMCGSIVAFYGTFVFTDTPNNVLKYLSKTTIIACYRLESIVNECFLFSNCNQF